MIKYIYNYDRSENMDKNKLINGILWISSVVSLALAVLTAVFGFTSENAFSKAVLL